MHIFFKCNRVFSRRDNITGIKTSLNKLGEKFSKCPLNSFPERSDLRELIKIALFSVTKWHKELQKQANAEKYCLNTNGPYLPIVLQYSTNDQDCKEWQRNAGSYGLNFFEKPLTVFLSWLKIIRQFGIHVYKVTFRPFETQFQVFTLCPLY